MRQWLARSQFLRFCVVGTMGFIVDSAMLFFLHRWIGLDPYSARAISILTAMNCTWLGNRLITFRSHAATTRHEILFEWSRFVAANSFGAAVNYGTYALIVRFAPEPADSPYVALVCGVAVGLFVNFALSKRLVFRTRPAGDYQR